MKMAKNKKSIMYYFIIGMSALIIILNVLGLAVYAFAGTIQSMAGSYFLAERISNSVTTLSIALSLAAIVIHLIFLNFFVKGKKKESVITGLLAYGYMLVSSLINFSVFPLLISIIILGYILGFKINISRTNWCFYL